VNKLIQAEPSKMATVGDLHQLAPRQRHTPGFGQTKSVPCPPVPVAK
jgi:hypothetical protein